MFRFCYLYSRRSISHISINAQSRVLANVGTLFINILAIIYIIIIFSYICTAQ